MSASQAALLLEELTLAGIAHLVLGVALGLHVLLNKHRPVSAVLWLVANCSFSSRSRAT